MFTVELFDHLTVCKWFIVNKIFWIKWNHLTVRKRMSSSPFRNVIDKMCSEIICLIYMYKNDLALNNLQWLICYETKPNQQRPIFDYLVPICLLERGLRFNFTNHEGGGRMKKMSTLMEAPLWYNFKESPHVYHPSKHIFSISIIYVDH